jgi:hypothetical protein
MTDWDNVIVGNGGGRGSGLLPHPSLIDPARFSSLNRRENKSWNKSWSARRRTVLRGWDGAEGYLDRRCLNSVADANMQETPSDRNTDQNLEGIP